MKDTMINIDSFIDFVKRNFDVVSVDNFKHDLKFVEIDCLRDARKKIILDVADNFIKISAVEKAATLDFSLHDYYFEEREAAEKLLLAIKQTGIMPE